MEKIELTLLQEKRNGIKNFSYLLLTIHLIIFSVGWYSKNSSIIPVIITLIFTLLLLLRKRILSGKVFNTNITFIVLAVAWLFLYYYLMALVCIVLYMLSRIIESSVTFVFADKEIIKRSWRLDRYLWSDFNNIILKDNLLTLDFKNNKIYQREVSNKDIEEQYFNNFVSDHLKKEEI